MKFTVAIVAIVGLVSAIAVEDSQMTQIRRGSLFGRHHKGVQPATAAVAATPAKAVTTGACCVEGVSQKEDACKDQSGAAGVCVPDNQEGCNGALTCVALTQVTCNAAVIERGQPTCRRVTAGQTANGLTVARTG